MSDWDDEVEGEYKPVEVSDWNDSNELKDMGNHVVRVANKYRMAKHRWGKAKESLDFILAASYKSGYIERKHSYEKALLMLVEDSIGTEREEEIKGYYSSMINNKVDYSGLEALMKAHDTQISLCQSLIKNQVRNG